MKERSHMGITCIRENMQKHDSDVKHALIIQSQKVASNGIQGEPLPYLLRSDWLVTSILFICFFLFSYVLKNGKKFILFQIKDLFQHKTRASLFDDTPSSNERYTLCLICITVILCALCLYDFQADSDRTQTGTIPHPLLLSVNTLLILLYVVLKCAVYHFVNWIFFDIERRKMWMKTYFSLIGSCSFLLFPLVLFIIYFNPDYRTSVFSELCIIFIVETLLFYKCIRIFFNQIQGFLHLILYFCTLEIVPLFLLWKGIAYINKILILNF